MKNVKENESVTLECDNNSITKTGTLKHFVQTFNRIAPFFEEEEFDSLEAAEAFAERRNEFYSIDGGGDDTFYCEVVSRIE